MNPNPAHIEALWVRSLADELTPREEQELLEALSSDPVLRGRLHQDEGLDGLLHILPRIKDDSDGFAQRFADRLAKESGKTQFALRVEQRIKRERRVRPTARFWRLLVPGLAAAAVLIVLYRVTTVPATPPEKRAELPSPMVASEPPAALAVIEQAQGSVFVAEEGTRRTEKAKNGEVVRVGQGIQTDPSGYAVLKFNDGTRVEVHPQTTIGEIVESTGKQIVIAQGAVTANVTPQPRERPMLIRTPQAEVKVLGTVFRTISAGSETRVDVMEGTVRLARKTDQGSVDLTAGHFGLVAPGAELTSRAAERRTGARLVIDFEDRDLHLWRVGELSTDHSRPGSHYCIKAGLEEVASWGYDVHIYGYQNQLFRYAANLVIEFDYWAERGTEGLFLQLGHFPQGEEGNRNRSYVLKPIKHEQWVHLAVPITEVKRYPDVPCKEGDWIWKLNIGPIPSPSKPPRFYLDNLQVAPP